MILYSFAGTPIGNLLLAGAGGRLQQIHFAPADPEDGWKHDPVAFRDAAKQLVEYFDGKRREFDLDIEMIGTSFQLEVWSALRRIPYGEVCTYSDIARRIGRPNAVRAVGAANGANPIPIIVPCHRVIGSNGSLTGFGGGLDVKRRLLDLEQRGYALRLF